MLGKSLKEVIHETAKDLFDVGAIDQKTMRDFDSLVLPAVDGSVPD